MNEDELDRLRQDLRGAHRTYVERLIAVSVELRRLAADDHGARQLLDAADRAYEALVIANLEAGEALQAAGEKI